MRYLIGCIALIFVYSGCSSTETVQQQQVQDEPVSIQPAVPPWYSSGVHSSSDSLALHGYSLASATDSSSAAELSTENSLDYLRFEIDRTVEQVRQDLADSPDGSSYNSSTFIIRLRKTVSEISLSSASLSRMHTISENGIHLSYTRATIPRTNLFSLLESQLQDDRFLEQLRSFSL